MATYPDTRLESDDEADPLYGGEAGRAFGGEAWDWAANAIRAIQNRIVLHVSKPWRMQRVTVVDAVTAGDILVFDLNGSGTQYSVNKIGNVTYSEDTTPRCGMAYEGASADEKCWVIFDGLGIPPSIHQLAAGTAAYVFVNKTTSRLNRSTGAAGELICGVINTKGYVFMFPKTGEGE